MKEMIQSVDKLIDKFGDSKCSAEKIAEVLVEFDEHTEGLCLSRALMKNNPVLVDKICRAINLAAEKRIEYEKALAAEKEKELKEADAQRKLLNKGV